MAKEVGIEIPEYFLDELEIPEDFLKNNDFIIDLESCFNDLKRKKQNITEEQLREFICTSACILWSKTISIWQPI